jgi:hypothetical protein
MTETPPGWENILAPGETILWQGQPDAGVDWSALARPTTVFGLAFMAFAIFLLTRPETGGNPLAYFVFMAFMLLGAHLAVGRLFWDAYRHGKTHYTLSNRTAFVATDVMGRRDLRSIPLSRGMPLTLQDGVPGSVVFGADERVIPGRWQGSRSDGMYVPAKTVRRPLGFLRIADARAVFGLMQQAIAALADPPPAR